MSSPSETDGVVRVVFATIILGMGVDFKSLDYIVHYGAPHSLEDYIQESGRAGRDHQQPVSRIYSEQPSCLLGMATNRLPSVILGEVGRTGAVEQEVRCGPSLQVG